MSNSESLLDCEVSFSEKSTTFINHSYIIQSYTPTSPESINVLFFVVVFLLFLNVAYL